MNDEYVYIIFRCSQAIVDYDDDSACLYKIVKTEEEAKYFKQIKDKYNFYFYKYIKLKINEEYNINLEFNSLISYSE